MRYTLKKPYISPHHPMKKRYQILIGLLILIAFPFIVVGINQVISSYYNRYFNTVEAGVSSAHYTLKKVAVTGSFEYHPGETKRSTNDTVLTEGIDGYLYFDTLQNVVKVEYKNYASSLEDDNPAHMVTIDLTGKVLQDLIIKNTEYEQLRKNCIILKDEMKPFQKWTDPAQVIYLKHFHLDDFNSFKLFNPLSGMGGNGGTPYHWWDGEAFYALKQGNEVLKFKLPCQSAAMLFPGDFDYDTGVNYYRLPAQYKTDVAFLVYAVNNTPNSLYIVKHQ